MATVTPATLDDLYRTDGKAELIGGRIVQFMSSGYLPSRVAFRISMQLFGYAEKYGGAAFPDGLAYALPQPLINGRQSFSPDASYYLGPFPANQMRFIEGVPQLAVEVRSENDYGRAAEVEIEDKRADYFEAGTLVVWDVDPLAQTIAVYRAAAPDAPAVYRIGDEAEAEPALPGWNMRVAEVFAG